MKTPNYNIHNAPELLAPAGNLDKFMVAMSYGADAVYLGGQDFGLRAASDNFTDEELKYACSYAHNLNKKVFVVLNSFLHDEECETLTNYVSYLESIKVDAVIVSDLGAIEIVKNTSDIPIHLSTQASCLNLESAKFWKKVGVKRVILGRETSLAHAGLIKRETGLEVELFIHGALCMSYSGNCVISNYTSGRDSNRGGCAQSCRHEYSLQYDNEVSKTSTFMSSKDLLGLRAIEDFYQYGIDSLKIEGRMKGHLYLSTVTKTYREGIDRFLKNKNLSDQDIFELESELRRISHRDYTSGGLYSIPKEDSVYNERDNENKDYQVIGDVLESLEDHYTLLKVRSNFKRGDLLEVIPFKGSPINHQISFIQTVDGEDLTDAKPNSIVKIPFVMSSPYNIVRKKLDISL